MKYFKRLKLYKASNVTFDPELVEARSYDWWVFVARINGKVVFNNYSYSNSTAKHQNKVRGLLRELGIKIDLEVRTVKSLNNSEAARDILVEMYHNEKFDLIPLASEVLKTKLTQAEIDEIYIQKEESLCTEYLRRALKYQEKKASVFRLKVENYLENDVCFRDYEIYSASRFGDINSIAVHQIVEPESMERDIENALHSFHRDGFGSICLYIPNL